MGGKSRRTSRTGTLHATAEALRRYALSLPDAYEEYPWGERVAKVRKKVFVFLGRSADLDEHLGFSVKLPASADGVLTMPFATPTGYGLGKSGWVSIRSPASAPLPLELLMTWVEESYRAVAPKKLIATLDQGKQSPD